MKKIYTKTGDKGQTSLIGGTKVSKSNIKIEAYGTVDELNSIIGVVATYITDEVLTTFIHKVQCDLFDIGALLAEDSSKNKMPLPKVEENDITLIEKQIDSLDAHLPILKHFILPGGHISAAQTHLARCICRRAERRIVELSIHEVVEPIIIKYLNRLSDFLFLLARKLNADHQSRRYGDKMGTKKKWKKK